MRIPTISVSPILRWFAEEDIGSASVNVADQFSEKSIVFLSDEQADELDRIISDGRSPFSTEAFEIVRSAIAASALSNGKFADRCVQIKERQDRSGNLSGTLRDSNFKQKLSELRNQIKRDETPESTFERIFGFHVANAKKLVIIDPWLGKNLLSPSSTSRKIFVEKLLPVVGLEIEIHTLMNPLPKGYLAPDIKRELRRNQFFELLDCAHQLSDLAGRQRKDFVVCAYLESNKLRDRQTVSFPHDRHFEFVFGSKSNPSQVSDYFALGNGLDIFAPNRETGTSRATSSFYLTEAERMWGPFDAETRKALAYKATRDFPVPAKVDAELS